MSALLFVHFTTSTSLFTNYYCRIRKQTFQDVNKGQQDITCFCAGRLVSDSDHTSSALNPTKAMVSLFFAVDAPHRSCHSHGLLVVGRICGLALAWA